MMTPRSRCLLGCALFAVALMMGRSAEAASFTVNFCPGDSTCPTGITEARLTFDEILTGSDPNDYNLTIRIVGNSSAPKYLDEVSFSSSGVATPGGYEFLPTLNSAPTGGSPWNVFFDNVNGGPGCGAPPASSQEVCAQSTGYGPSAQQVNEFKFLVDLAGTFTLGVGTTANLRAQFLNASG